MADTFRWSTAFKIARREARASRAKFLFVVLAVAAGVGSLTGVRGFSTSFRNMLLRDARTLMAADLSARVFALPNESQMGEIHRLESRGVRWTWVTETITMVSSPAVPDPVLVSVKAVDPKVYPFYGIVKLNPAGPLEAALDSGAIVVSNDLLLRLKVNVGDTVRAGGQEFRVAALVETEPDRMSGTLNVGPRVMMSREGLDRTGLIRFGSRAAQRFLFKLPPGGSDVERTRRILVRTFPDAQVIDFRQTHPTITRGLDRATTFLSLVSLVALIVGALGVATAMHSHLQQKMDSIAIMKCLGARSGQIIQIYVAQTLGLGLAGGLVGIALGLGVQRVFPSLIARYFQLQIGLEWNWAGAAQGLIAGLLTTLLFTLPPLLSIRRVHPGLVLRREMPESKGSWRTRLRDARSSLLSGALILCGLGGIAAWLSNGSAKDSMRLGVYFIGGMTGALLALAGVAWGLLWCLKALLRGPMAARLPATMRHGVANLYRPGNQSQTALVALGLGVMFSLTIYLVQHSMLIDIARTAPPGMPNVFLVGITEAQKESVREMLRAQPGVEGAPEIVPNVAVRLVSVDGTPVEQLALQGWGRRFLQTRPASFAASRPEHTEVLQGAWWTGQSAQVAVSEEAAKNLERTRRLAIAVRRVRQNDRRARGGDPSNGSDTRGRGQRIHFRSRDTGRVARNVLWGSSREAASGCGIAANSISHVPDGECRECGRRAADRAGCGGSDRAHHPVHFAIHDFGRGDYSGRKCRWNALQADSRGGYFEDSGSDSAACGRNFFGGVFNTGSCGRIDGKLRWRRAFPVYC